MSFKSRFYAIAMLISFVALAPLTSAQAGQLFPPSNIGSHPDVDCPNGSVLSWRGAKGEVECVNPTPGVTVSCPAGQVLTGITNGVAACESLPAPTASGTFDPATCHMVTNRGGPPFYISDARCAPGEFLLNGGGRSEVPGSDLCAGITKSFMHTSMPDGDLMGWSVDAFNNTWTGEACTEAYAICCLR